MGGGGVPDPVSKGPEGRGDDTVKRTHTARERRPRGTRGEMSLETQAGPDLAGPCGLSLRAGT